MTTFYSRNTLALLRGMLLLVLVLGLIGLGTEYFVPGAL